VDNAVEYSSWSDWCKTFTVDPLSRVYYRWLMVISIAVVYNLIVIIARSIFWKLHDNYMYYWLVTDYIADVIYLTDIVVNLRTGDDSRSSVICSLLYSKSFFCRRLGGKDPSL